MRPAAVLVLLLPVALAAACSREAAPPAPAQSAELPIAGLPAIEAPRLLEQTRALSSDEFKGRKPGTEGETRTVEYLEQQFKALGLQPGNTDGTYVQDVRLVGITGSEQRPLTVTGHGKKATLKWRDDVVAWTKRVADAASLENSEMVFVGYGVAGARVRLGRLQGRRREGQDDRRAGQRPAGARSRQGRRARRETVRRPGDDLLRPLDLQVRGGRAAAAPPASSSSTRPARPATRSRSCRASLGEQFDLDAADSNMGRASVEGWLSLDAGAGAVGDGGAGLRRAQGAGR